MLCIKIFKSKNGNKGACLCVNLGYRVQVISWDIQLCAEVLRISVVDLLNKDFGVYELNVK